MVHPLIKIGAAFALGGAFFACPAYAVSPLALDTSPSLLVPVQDEENEEVWRDFVTSSASGRRRQEGGLHNPQGRAP
jgi:hypothetical protein